MLKYFKKHYTGKVCIAYIKNKKISVKQFKKNISGGLYEKDYVPMSINIDGSILEQDKIYELYKNDVKNFVNIYLRIFDNLNNDKFLISLLYDLCINLLSMPQI